MDYLVMVLPELVLLYLWFLFRVMPMLEGGDLRKRIRDEERGVLSACRAGEQT